MFFSSLWLSLWLSIFSAICFFSPCLSLSRIWLFSIWPKLLFSLPLFVSWSRGEGLTISLPRRRRFEHRLDRRVVGEPQREPGLAQLATRGRPGRRRDRRDDVSRQEVVDRLRGGGSAQPLALGKLGEELRIPARAEVEVSAE